MNRPRRDTAPTPRRTLWRTARARVDGALAALAAPRETMRLVCAPLRTLGQMRAWLRPVEALLRDLIYLQAARLAPRPAGRSPLDRRGRERIEDPRDPRSWTARFRVRLAADLKDRDAAALLVPGADARRGGLAGFDRRLDALIRVAANPTRYARRLARRLRRDPALAKAHAETPLFRSERARRATVDVARAMPGATAAFDTS